MATTSALWVGITLIASPVVAPMAAPQRVVIIVPMKATLEADRRPRAQRGHAAVDDLGQADDSMRRLRTVAVLAYILMVAAAATQAAGYVLYSLGDPRSHVGEFWGAILIGAIPGVTTAGAIARAIRRRVNPRRTVVRLRVTAAVGLPFIFFGGALSGFALALLGPPPGSPAALAASVYVVTFLAAVLGDIVLLVVALFTRPPARPPLAR